jgi:hypothetical protein
MVGVTGEGGGRQTILREDDPLAVTAVQAVHTGDLEGLGRLLRERPDLATARIQGRKGASSTLLHAVADWPGFFPNGAAVVRLLIEAGADPNAPVLGSWHAETPLHWAASSDDLEVAEALLDGGADVEAQGGSIAGGTPLDNAVGYGCWQVARLLVERGAKVTKLWHAAALGLMRQVAACFAADPPPTPQEVHQAFWHACAGGQPRAAAYLLARGADLHFIPDYAKGTPLDAARGLETRRQILVDWLQRQGARSTAEREGRGAGLP